MKMISAMPIKLLSSTNVQNKRINEITLSSFFSGTQR